MFSLSFAVFLLFIFGIHGETNDINTFRSNNLDGYPFGKLRLSEEGKNEELIPTTNTESPQSNPDQSSGVQPLPSPCIGASPSTKLAYPKEKTKYIQCRDEFHYEIFTCPIGGDYNEQTNSCDLFIPVIDKCEQEKPCLNDGHCILLSNSTFKCNCRQDWTGDRCETPLNSCVKKPCGPNAECRTLKTIDYEQDYVCVCHETKNYGLNCQEVVPNPCLTSNEQFFPYAFSQRAYVQCNGDLIYFQPCGPSLYWNQIDKLCDRKRSPKIDLPALLVKLGLSDNNNRQENNKEIINDGIILTTTVQTEQQNLFIQNGKENEGIFAFVPSRVANRQQLQANMNQQQDLFNQNLPENEKQTQQLSNQLSQPVESNQMRQNLMSKVKQWPNQQTESTIRQPPTMQLGQNQPWLQNPQQQWTPTLTEALSMNSNIGQSQIRQDNQQQQQQQQNFPQQNQVFGSQQWLNQVPDIKTQNNQRFGSPSQSWQGSQTIQNQPQFQAQNQQTFLETSTATPNIVLSQGFQNPNAQAQDQPWQNRPNTQLIGNQLPQSASFNTQNTQNFVPQPQSWQGSQSFQNQQWPSTLNSQSSTDLKNGQLQKGIQPQIRQDNQQQQQNFPQQNQVFGSQQWLNQVPDIKIQNNQRFGSPSQSWQGSQTIQNQPQFQAQNQQTFLETSTATPNIVLSQGFQNPNTQAQDQSWQNIPNTQQIQNQVNKLQSNQIFAFQPKQWPETSKQTQQSSSINPSSEIQNTQFGLNQKQEDVPIQNSFGQKRSWLDNQQFQPQGNQLTDSDDLKIQTNQNFAARPAIFSQSQPWSQTGQLIGNSFETTTISNKGLPLQGLRGWQPGRTNEQTTEQRKTLDSIPTLSSGSWKFRS